MKLSQNFNLDEFTFSRTALKLGIENEPDQEVIENLQRLVDNVLQPLRNDVGALIVTSGYRSPQLNGAIGGVSNSQHVKGEAADIISPKLSSEELFLIISMEYKTDQLIQEFGRWIHVSYCENNRNERYRSYRRTGDVVYIPVPHINK